MGTPWILIVLSLSGKLSIIAFVSVLGEDGKLDKKIGERVISQLSEKSSAQTEL